jgi:hypothetical protein
MSGWSWGGALARVVFLRFLYYDVSGQRQFSTAPEIAAAYVAPAAAAVLCFASMHLGPIRKISLLMSYAALTVSAYATELVLVASRGGPILPIMTLLQDSSERTRGAESLARRFGRQIDSRSAAEVLADLQQQGIEGVPIVAPMNHLFIDRPDGTIESSIRIAGEEVVPLGSVSNRLTLLCNENGQWVHYHSDGRGFNNPDDVWTSGEVQIAAVGDSFRAWILRAARAELRCPDPPARARDAQSRDGGPRSPAGARHVDGVPAAPGAADRAVVLLRGGTI